MIEHKFVKTCAGYKRVVHGRINPLPQDVVMKMSLTQLLNRCQIVDGYLHFTYNNDKFEKECERFGGELWAIRKRYKELKANNNE